MIKGELMKNPLLMAAATLLALGLAHTGSAQGPQGRGGPPAAPTITTLAGDVQADWAIHKELLVNAADAMPDDKFGYQPTPGQQSYGVRIMHVVQVNQALAGLLGGKTPVPAINLKAATKAEVMTALRQSMDYLEVVLKEFTDQQLNERVAAGGVHGAVRQPPARVLPVHAAQPGHLRADGGVPPPQRHRAAGQPPRRNLGGR